MLSTKKIIIIILIIMVVIGAGFFAWTNMGNIRYWILDINKELVKQKIVKQEEVGNETRETEEPVETSSIVSPPPITNQSGASIPRDVHSYQGEVLEKAENSLKIKISAFNNYIEADQIIEVGVDKKTRITKIVITTAELGAKPQIKMETISADEINIGDRVTVTSSQNIVGKTAFRAQSIRKVE